MKGTLPYEVVTAQSNVEIAKLLFASGFEKQMVSMLMRFNNFVATNEKGIKSFGEKVGRAVQKIIEVGNAALVILDPLFKSISNFIMNTPAEELAQLAIDIAALVLALKGLSFVFKVALAIQKLVTALVFLKNALSLEGLTTLIIRASGAMLGLTAALAGLVAYIVGSYLYRRFVAEKTPEQERVDASLVAKNEADAAAYKTTPQANQSGPLQGLMNSPQINPLGAGYNALQYSQAQVSSPYLNNSNNTTNTITFNGVDKKGLDMAEEAMRSRPYLNVNKQ